MSGQPSEAWKVISDYLAGREQFDPAAARLAVVLRQPETPSTAAAEAGDAKRLYGHLQWFRLDAVPEADRGKVSALIKRAFGLLDEGEAA